MAIRTPTNQNKLSKLKYRTVALQFPRLGGRPAKVQERHTGRAAKCEDGVNRFLVVITPSVVLRSRQGVVNQCK